MFLLVNGSVRHTMSLLFPQTDSRIVIFLQQYIQIQSLNCQATGNDTINLANSLPQIDTCVPISFIILFSSLPCLHAFLEETKIQEFFQKLRYNLCKSTFPFTKCRLSKGTKVLFTDKRVFIISTSGSPGTLV